VIDPEIHHGHVGIEIGFGLGNLRYQLGPDFEIGGMNLRDLLETETVLENLFCSIVPDFVIDPESLHGHVGIGIGFVLGNLRYQLGPDFEIGG